MEEKNRHDGIRKSVKFIHKFWDECISIGVLADVAGLSRAHFVRAFTKEIGKPPHNYQLQLRLEKAYKLLRTGMSISEVASRTGFSDQSHFTRHFKKFSGMTPARYRDKRF